MRLIAITIFIFLTLSTSLSSAREVAGIEIDESIQIDSTQLMLNGSGIRSKFFFKIYVGSLYSKSKSPTLNGILNQGAPYRVSMHILYDEVSAKKLNGGWRAGFEKNLSKTELKDLQTDINHFYTLFKTVHRGDVIDIDVNASGVSTVYLNGTKQGEINNTEFTRALLMIWLGDEPADDDLKSAMLGE